PGAAHGAGGATSALRGVRLRLSHRCALLATEHARPWLPALAARVRPPACWCLAAAAPTLPRCATRPPRPRGATPRRALIGRGPAGLRWGDWRFGLSAVRGLAVVAVPLIALASGDAGRALTYPGAGAWPGESLGNLLLWVGVYFLYYLAFEAFYRGFVLHAAMGLGAARAISLQAIMATLVHLGKSLPEVLAVAPVSRLFAVLALRSR